MEKILNFIQKIGQFFTGVFNIASYTEHQENTTKTLKDLSENIKVLSTNIQTTTEATNSLSKRITTLDCEIGKIKNGLQIELFGSLQALHTKLCSQHFATPEQKHEAQLYYDQIHNLGKDGWSEKYYTDILSMPESREEYWKSLNT